MTNAVQFYEEKKISFNLYFKNVLCNGTLVNQMHLHKQLQFVYFCYHYFILYSVYLIVKI